MLQLLQKIYSIPKNEISARLLLMTRKMNYWTSSFGVRDSSPKDCNFKAVSAEGDAFTNGLLSNSIRSLLESPTLELYTAHTQAVALVRAQRNSSSCNVSSFAAFTANVSASKSSLAGSTEMVGALQKRQRKKCFYCGSELHSGCIDIKPLHHKAVSINRSLFRSSIMFMNLE